MIPRIILGTGNGSWGSGKDVVEAVKPVTEDWIDLSTAGGLTLAPDASLGFHDYSYDIAVGPKGETTVVGQDTEGLFFSAVSSVDYTSTLLILPGACSLRYDPYFEFIIKTTATTGYYVGVGSEALGDGGVVYYKNGHRGLFISGANPYESHRAGGVTGIGGSMVAGYWRVTLWPEDGGKITIRQIPSGSSSDWDDMSNTPIYDVFMSKSLQLIGGNVLVPMYGTQHAFESTTNKILATRTTMRRP